MTSSLYSRVGACFASLIVAAALVTVAFTSDPGGLPQLGISVVAAVETPPEQEDDLERGIVIASATLVNRGGDSLC